MLSDWFYYAGCCGADAQNNGLFFFTQRFSVFYFSAHVRTRTKVQTIQAQRLHTLHQSKSVWLVAMVAFKIV